jgi:hypothetical protein
MKKIKELIKRTIESILSPINKSLNRLDQLSRINTALSRASATAALRVIEPKNPISWEFSGFSQNGEDGILDYLSRKLVKSNRYFIEIGASDGIENNTAWFAHGRKFSGLMIEGNRLTVDRGQAVAHFATDLRWLFVNKENINTLIEWTVYKNPDIFSLDIDGNDFYIAKLIFEAGFRPKIFIVEYNSSYGPTDEKTVIYDEDFNLKHMHSTQLYYGVSISGWKSFFKGHGYKFVTVDSNGVNAIFIDPSEFDESFVEHLQGLDFKENFYQMKKFKFSWEKQYDLIKEMEYYTIHQS